MLADYVRERHLLTLEQAIHKMTMVSARHMAINDRGIIATGAYADLVLFDPNTIKDQATMSDTNRISTGIMKTWVNGQVVFSDGKATRVLPGQVVRRPADLRGNDP